MKRQRGGRELRRKRGGTGEEEGRKEGRREI
jgi:hypothetical protein